MRLDLVSVPQPDLLLRLPEHAGGRSRRTVDDYLEGPPELAIEIAASSSSYDLHQKLHAYLRNGVLEYLVYRTEDRDVDWFVRERSQYIRQQPDARGVLASRLFPGLVLDCAGAVARRPGRAARRDRCRDRNGGARSARGVRAAGRGARLNGVERAFGFRSGPR